MHADEGIRAPIQVSFAKDPKKPLKENKKPVTFLATGSSLIQDGLKARHKNDRLAAQCRWSKNQYSWYKSSASKASKEAAQSDP